jgi:hypothetical protein
MHLLIQLLELATIGWLPGAAMFRVPWLNRERRAALDAEERVFWAVILSLAVSLSAVLALASVHRYSFRNLMLADLAVATLSAAVGRGQLRLGTTARRVSFTAAIPVLLIALGAIRFFPPAEYVIGGKDPGVYMNEGIQIAQRGGLVIRDPVVAAVPPFARPLFFPAYGQTVYDSLRFMGFFITDLETGRVVGQFPHLFPASIAIGYGIDGLTGARRTVGVWALLGLVAVYFAGVRVIGRTAATAAAALLALNIIQVWFAKYPNAEVAMQGLLFAALLANARAHVDGDRFFAPVAGFLLGLLLFVRFDAVLAIAGIGGALALGLCNGQRLRASFVLTLTAVSALASLYLLGPMRAYADRPIIFLHTLPVWEAAILAAVALAGGAVILWRARVSAPSPAANRWAPLVIVGAVWLLALYALVFRFQAGKLAVHDAEALRTFTNYYVTLPALLAALIGLALAARRWFWRDPALIVTVLVFACFFFYKLRIVPEHFWMTRRFLPVILPGVLLLASAAALGGIGRPSRNAAGLIRTLVRVVFVAVLAFQYARASRPVLNHVEYAGLIPRLEQLAAAIGDDDLVIAEGRDAQTDIHVLALPLAYIYARNVLVLHSPRPDKAVLAQFLEWARTRYRRILFMGGGSTDLLSHRYGVRPLASDRFQVPEFDAPMNGYPQGVRQKEFEYGLYEFTAPQPAEGLWFDLDIGDADDLHVLRFHAREKTAGRTFRWTRATSYVSVTNIPPTSREVSVWMDDGGRPGGVPAAEVSVFLHGELLGTATVHGGFRPYAFAIPVELAARAAAAKDVVELRLVSPTWKPRLVLGTPDDRDLGVMVDRVAVR